MAKFREAGISHLDFLFYLFGFGFFPSWLTSGHLTDLLFNYRANWNNFYLTLLATPSRTIQKWQSFLAAAKNCINSPMRNGLSSTDSLSCPYLTSSTAVVGDCQRNHSVPFWLITVLIFILLLLLKKKKKSKTPKQNDPSYQLQNHFRSL